MIVHPPFKSQPGKEKVFREIVSFPNHKEILCVQRHATTCMFVQVYANPFIGEQIRNIIMNWEVHSIISSTQRGPKTVREKGYIVPWSCRGGQAALRCCPCVCQPHSSAPHTAGSAFWLTAEEMQLLKWVLVYFMEVAVKPLPSSFTQ